MGEPSWQETLRLRLAERNARESAYAPIIEQYRRLAQQAKLLKERNVTLLRAMNSTTRPNPSGSTGSVPGNGSGADESPAQIAYIASLDSQISSLRDELATVYKTQGQNAQRLLAMTETLREREELSRIESENLRRAREEIHVLRKKVEQHNELMSEKDRTHQVLHDEINTLQLELGQIEERNQALVKDNAKLLQRWLDAKQAEVNKMNEVNEFYEDMKMRKNTQRDDAGSTGVRPASHDPESGNGETKRNSGATTTTDGMPSHAEKDVTLTPNG